MSPSGAQRVRRVRSFLPGLTGVALAGCAIGSPAFTPPAPDRLPELERALETDPTHAEAALQLAAGYWELGRVEDAHRALAKTDQAMPNYPAIVPALAAAEHELGRFDEAWAHYTDFAERFSRSDLGVLASYRAATIEAEARRLEVSRLLPEPDGPWVTESLDRVVVVELTQEGADPRAEALAVMATEELIAHLAGLGMSPTRLLFGRALTQVLETIGSGSELSVAVRAGRLTGAGHATVGALRIDANDRLTVAVSVVSASAMGALDVQRVVVEEDVRLAMDAVRRLSIEVFEATGGVATPETVERMASRPSLDFDSYLRFAEGRRAVLDGDFQVAGARFDEAVSADPTSVVAEQEARQAQLGLGASEVPPEVFVGDATRLAQRSIALDALLARPGSPRVGLSRTFADRDRAVVPELLGLDRLGSGIVLELLFRVSGGSDQ